MNPSPSTVIVVEIPPWVAPIPVSPTLCIPSTKIWSPDANGWTSKPLIGVSKKQVTTPDLLVCSELIPTPLVLSIDTILCTTESNPDIGDTTSTLDIVWFGTDGINDKSSTTSPETGLKTINFGVLT